MAEIRKQALLASGVQIEALQQPSGAGPVPKKVVYGNRKKKPVVKDASPAPESRPRSPEAVRPPSPPPAPEKDDWDATSEEEDVKVEEGAKAPAPEGVKDSWDDSSDEEKPSAPVDAKPAAPSKAQSKGEGDPSPWRVY